MRIGFFTDFYRPQINGISFSIDSFRAELEAQGHEVYIFAPSAKLRHRELDKHIIRFPAVKGIFFEDYLTSLFFPPSAIRKIEKLNLDLVHYHTPSQIGILGAYFAIHHDLPLVSTYHTDLYQYVKHYPAVLPGIVAMSLLIPAITKGGSEEYRRAFSSIKPGRTINSWNQRVIERGLTILHNACDLVIVPSRKIETQLHHWKTTTPVVVLPTGSAELPISSTDDDWARRRLHLGDGSPTILSVGRLGKEKNIELLIEAFALVAAKEPSAKLVIVGDGPDESELKAMAKRLGIDEQVTFVGKVEQHRLGPIYHEATVFAFPSQTDTQGLVLNEAAAAGLPIVLVDPDISEVAKPGYNALIAKPTTKDLAAKLLTIIENPGKTAEMGQHSRQLASEFLPGRQAEKLLDLYQEVLTRHGQKTTSNRHRWLHKNS